MEEQLRNGYDIDIFWYNPNIYPAGEYERRLVELRRFSSEVLGKGIIEPSLTDDRLQWDETVVDYALDEEGKRRCNLCIGFRLHKAAEYASNHGYDMLATTLSVSPHKNAAMINAIGRHLQESYGIPFLEADFKKANGYLRSVELSKRYGLYRQTYCGCVYSMKESLLRKKSELLSVG